ncbi:MAG: tyrosinase cofactor [Pseudomonadota bacterium]|nr:tyrosinase cofactor [Pseudomonadota bacterium]
MAEQRETYKGREIILRTGAEASSVRAAAGIREDEAGADGAELTIDGERIFTVRDAGGAFIASGFAFDPQPLPIALARKIIDYRETGE